MNRFYKQSYILLVVFTAMAKSKIGLKGKKSVNSNDSKNSEFVAGIDAIIAKYKDFLIKVGKL